MGSVIGQSIRSPPSPRLVSDCARAPLLLFSLPVASAPRELRFRATSSAFVLLRGARYSCSSFIRERCVRCLNNMSAAVAEHRAIPPFRVRNEEPCVRPASRAGGTGITARLQALLPPGSHLNCDGVKLEDNGMTTDFTLPASGSTYCGRDHKSCEVWIPDIHCSRRHAEIIVDRKGARLGIVRVRASIGWRAFNVFRSHHF